MKKQELVKIYTAGSMIDATLIEGLLEANNIKAFLLNKKDSEWLIGDVEIYVESKDSDAAKTIIKNRPQ
ncbi:MAG: DUF2007 domain-containing protein [Bacilli bacterium]|nr:DUF2007 domain-containing protein [Bacilli bacterium]